MGRPTGSCIGRVTAHGNERSYVIQLISEINDYVKGRDIRIRRAGGEVSLRCAGSVKFPDILLFSDDDQSIILQGWEAKCPDVPIDDAAFVSDAHNKARLMGCDSCVLWNFQYAQLHILGDDGAFRIAERWEIDPRIVDREAIPHYTREWRAFLHRLLDVVNGYVTTGRIKHRSLGEVLADSVMPAIINQNKGLVARRLKAAAARDACVSAAIGAWWASVQHEYMHDETDPFSAYAKVVLVNWLNKFIFANVLQLSQEAARDVENIDVSGGAVGALERFEGIATACGYRNVFAPMEFAEEIPPETWEDLVAFNRLLLECEVGNLESGFRHRILEDTVSVAKRQIAGQYPTPAPLARLMAEIAVRNAYGDVWDCCCGTGTIGCAVWQRKVEMLRDVDPNCERVATETTWMSDIHDFPLQIAMQSLSTLAPVNSPLMIFRANVFDESVDVPVEVIDPETGDSLRRPLLKFDAIVSNLPFVDFNTDEVSWYASAKQRVRRECEQECGVSLSDRCDLYCYIVLHLRPLLKEEGTMCLLTSNSWLSTAAGDEFMAALRGSFEIEGVYANGPDRWFSEADSMNALLVLHGKRRRDGAAVSSAQGADATACAGAWFGTVSASIDQLADNDARGGIASGILLHRAGLSPFLSERRLPWGMVDELKRLGVSYYALCQGAEFLLDIKDSLVPAASLFDIKRGVKSGDDRFFYSGDPDFVDEEFRVDLLRNMREIDTFVLKPNAYALSCDLSEKELERGGFEKTLAHIRAAAAGGINVSCRAHRPYWYTLPKAPHLTFATIMNADSRLFFAAAPKGSTFIANQRVVCFSKKDDGLDEELMLALLNSTLCLFLIEASSTPMALGALDTRATAFRAMHVPDPAQVSAEGRERILSAFEPLKHRPVGGMLDELEREDREAFDVAVLEEFGIAGKAQALRSAMRRVLRARLEVKR